VAQVKDTSDGDAKTLAGCALFFGGMALAALVVAWQFYMWLKTGHWPHLTMASVFRSFVSGTDVSEWMTSPRSGYGLHKAVNFLFELSLWLWLVFCASGAGISLID
jgi:hypothetical protein